MRSSEKSDHRAVELGMQRTGKTYDAIVTDGSIALPLWGR